MKLAATPEDEDAPRATRARPTPVERALAARLLTAEQVPGPVLCRACVLQIVEHVVRVSVEAAERDLRAAMKEQMQWPN